MYSRIYKHTHMFKYICSYLPICGLKIFTIETTHCTFLHSPTFLIVENKTYKYNENLKKFTFI